MPVHIHSITVDCHDHFGLADFWKQVLDGYSFVVRGRIPQDN
jgi:hypothetical protein